MAFEGLLVTEIFRSLQGETSLSGVPFVFIRLTGCNLRCTYCDSAYAFKGGAPMSLERVLERVRELAAPPTATAPSHVLLTGGEPLMQRRSVELVQALKAEGYTVSIETHGEASIREVAPHARIVMDVKTPSSKMSRGGWRKNLSYLKPTDEVKFVIASPEDYAWARSLVREVKWPVNEILFSPALPASRSPGIFPGVEIEWLAEAILHDKLPVRLQYQLHKLIWGRDRTGV